MRNVIHINLCISLSLAQLLFVIAVDKTGNKVCMCDNCAIFVLSQSHLLGAVFGHSLVPAVPVLGQLYVDANGRSGSLCSAGNCVHQWEGEEILNFIHSSQLWYVHNSLERGHTPVPFLKLPSSSSPSSLPPIPPFLLPLPPPSPSLLGHFDRLQGWPDMR